MTTIDAIAATSFLPQPAATAATGPKQQLDADMFMLLFTTQLRHQDPSSPMDTNQMMAQTAQLSMMEQLTNLSTTASENFALEMRQTAASLVGNTASYLDDNGDAISGVVSGVSFEKGVPTVTIGDKTISLDAVSGITVS
jgi:flagellar basal-body rod modification protein FlgD